ncbi:hypothetical protein D3C76_1225700 [compost metagenome]
MDVRVDAASGDDLAFGGDHFSARADRQGHPGLHIGITGFADAMDASVLDADVRLDDAPVVDDQRVGQHQVHGLGGEHLTLAHAVADHLAATELDLFAVSREVLFHLDPQLGVGQTHTVTDGGAEHVGVGPAGNPAHPCASSLPITRPWKP